MPRSKGSGPTWLHLTIVGLSGLIAVANEDQTDAKVQDEDSLVDTHARKPRTIIIVVVQASNGVADQGIIQA